jgi:4-hydroxythreonine-4-phosphate dehydrogenase
VNGVPRVAVSMGDPTGIGPEVTLAALLGRGRPRLTPILVGDRGVYEAAAGLLGRRARFAEWTPPAPLPREALAVRIISRLAPNDRRPGRPTVAGGRAAHAAILEAVRLVRAGMAQALVTAPICKANLVAAGLPVSGHTELLAELSGGAAVRMMMVGTRLRVVLVTTHLALRAVPDALNERLVHDTLVIANRALRGQFGIARPRIGIAGLNPHAGESGVFGDEEKRLIAPAVRSARRQGVDAQGPVAADSLFPLALSGRFDAVVCMYHDQGLAPFKLLHFADGVNLTIGLPFVRTSPDHGTAHDIAGRGVADPRSMASALRLAVALCRPATRASAGGHSPTLLGRSSRSRVGQRRSGRETGVNRRAPAV